MHLVAVQLDMIWQEKQVNHAKARKLLESASFEPGSLIVLPEMCDTGFSMNIQATAQTEARESEAFLRQLARDFDAAVMGGVVGPIVNGQASNEAVAFAPDGTELVRYRKMQPFSASGEDVKYRAGDRHQIFEWQGVKLAPFLCYDHRFPEVFRPAAREGAELIVVMACWPAIRSEHWVRLLQARAIENQAFTVGVNRCGNEPTLNFDGRSTGFDPHGNSLFETDGAEQVVSISIDAEVVRKWRRDFPALRDMKLRR